MKFTKKHVGKTIQCQYNGKHREGKIVDVVRTADGDVIVNVKTEDGYKRFRAVEIEDASVKKT